MSYGNNNDNWNLTKNLNASGDKHIYNKEINKEIIIVIIMYETKHLIVSDIFKCVSCGFSVCAVQEKYHQILLEKNN